MLSLQALETICFLSPKQKCTYFVPFVELPFLDSILVLVLRIDCSVSKS